MVLYVPTMFGPTTIAGVLPVTLALALACQPKPPSGVAREGIDGQTDLSESEIGGEPGGSDLPFEDASCFFRYSVTFHGETTQVGQDRICVDSALTTGEKAVVSDRLGEIELSAYGSVERRVTGAKRRPWHDDELVHLLGHDCRISRRIWTSSPAVRSKVNSDGDGIICAALLTNTGTLRHVVVRDIFHPRDRAVVRASQLDAGTRNAFAAEVAGKEFFILDGRGRVAHLDADGLEWKMAVAGSRRESQGGPNTADGGDYVELDGCAGSPVGLVGVCPLEEGLVAKVADNGQFTVVDPKTGAVTETRRIGDGQQDELFIGLKCEGNGFTLVSLANPPALEGCI